MKVLIDADLLLEILLNRSEVVGEIDEIWKLAKSHDIELFITDMGLYKIYLICRELTDEQSADEILNSLEHQLKSCYMNQNIIRSALLSKLKDFESAIESTCVNQMGFDGVVTHCLDNFSETDFKVWSIHELLVAFENINKSKKSKELYSWISNNVASDYEVDKTQPNILLQLNYNNQHKPNSILIESNKIHQTAIKKHSLKEIYRDGNFNKITKIFSNKWVQFMPVAILFSVFTGSSIMSLFIGILVGYMMVKEKKNNLNYQNHEICHDLN